MVHLSWYKFLVETPGDVVGITMVLLNPNLDGMKIGASGHASSTVLGRIVWERVEFREGLPGNTWDIFVGKTIIQCNEKDS